MKRYYFIFIIIFAAAVCAPLSGCKTGGTRTVVYTDDDPYLTTMTQVTTVPVDTYSQYMATYTPSESSDTNGGAPYAFFPDGLAADTGILGGASASFADGMLADMPPQDTAVTQVTAAPEETSAETEVPTVSDVSGTTDEPAETITAAPPSLPTGIKIERPPADTFFLYTISADTRATAVTTNANTSDEGGTDNADQYTE